MTKKRKDSPSASSNITDDVGPGSSSFINSHRDFPAAASASDSALFTQSSYGMFQFGQPGVYGGTMHPIPPALCSALDFTGDPPPVEDEQEHADLLSTYIAAELSDKDSDGQPYPYPFFDTFDELEQVNTFTPSTDPMTSPFPVLQQQPLFQPSNYSFGPSHFLPIEPYAPSSSALRAQGLPHRPRENTGPKAIRPIFPKDRAETAQAPPDSFDLPDLATGHRKRRALSPDGRENARQVRIKGACARCSRLRTKCDAVRPCTTCQQNQKRKFDFPCMTEFPEDRGPYFFHDVMYGHLDNPDAFSSMPQPTGKISFKLTLWQYFDDPILVVPVAEFQPRAEQDLTKSVFPVLQNGKKFEVHEEEILSPPLVPHLNRQSLPAYRKYFYRAVHRWLECARVHDDLEWHATFFREEHGKPWPRMILGHICRFYHDVTRDGDPVLRSVLCTTVLIYMLNHSFYIPPDDVKDVLNKMEFGAKYKKPPTEFVSPAYVDRFVKILLFPFFKAGVKATLAGLQKLYSPARPSRFTRDRLLAISIVLLIIAAAQQGKAIEKALAQFRKGNHIDPTEVYDHVIEMEKYIIDMVIDLWKYKFGGNTKFSDESSEDRIRAIAAKDFNIMEKFKNSYTEFKDSLQDLPTEVPLNLDTKSFCAENVERVLKKFYLCVFPTE